MATSGNPALPLIAKPEAFAAVGAPPPGDSLKAVADYEVRVRQALSSPGYPTDEQTLRRQVEQSVRRAYDPAGLARQQAAAAVAHYQDRREALRLIPSMGHDLPVALVPVIAGAITTAVSRAGVQ